jgi:hypothetical protein
MKPKRVKAGVAPLRPAEVTASDREALAEAYRSGLITAWKRDDERGYRLTLSDSREEYVDVAQLTGYLEMVRGGTARANNQATATRRRVPHE